VISLASVRLGPRADRLEEAAEHGAAAGFHSVFASVPPADEALARRGLGVAGVALAGVSSPPVTALARAPAAIDAAARAASALKTRLVVLDASALVAGPIPEADLEALSRVLFDATRRWAGATISVRSGSVRSGSGRGGAKPLLDLAAVEALLADLASKPVALFFDPAGVASPAEWAERTASKTTGVVLSEGTDVDWGTLREMTPSRAVRVLEVDRDLAPADVTAARRRFEESLGF
jgi:hypothetical protein